MENISWASLFRIHRQLHLALGDYIPFVGAHRRNFDNLPKRSPLSEYEVTRIGEVLKQRIRLFLRNVDEAILNEATSLAT